MPLVPVFLWLFFFAHIDLRLTPNYTITTVIIQSFSYGAESCNIALFEGFRLIKRAMDNESTALFPSYKPQWR
jgi:hypothetical protein